MPVVSFSLMVFLIKKMLGGQTDLQSSVRLWVYIIELMEKKNFLKINNISDYNKSSLGINNSVMFIYLLLAAS